MKAKDLVQLNNARRAQLTKENLQYYEDMLVYIRLSFNKSEQETEEILSELLDHLLEAQAEGKSATDIFGDDPKKYADSIVSELPQIVTKERFLFALMGILYFFAATVFLSGVAALFNSGSSGTYYIGTVTVQVLISIPIAMLLFYTVLRLLRWLCFTKLKKAARFTVLWLYGIASVGIFMIVIVLVPKFGPAVVIPAYAVIIGGVILFALARFVHKKSEA